MSTNDFETEHDPFEEAVETTNDEGADENADNSEEEEAADETESTDEEETDESTDEPGEEGEASSTKEKMIPESRFKAALENVTKERDTLKQENESYKQQNAPAAPNAKDDPDGYAAFVRLNTSKAIMRQTHEDYVPVIQHFQKMAELNPHLNQLVADHEMPAKFAYDLAKRDIEIAELSKLKDDPDYIEFQEFKKNKGKTTTKTTAEELASVTRTGTSNLPKNLNRATSANKAGKQALSDDNDYLFKDSVL